MTFRWYGKDDPVSLQYIKQIPVVKGIVSALYDVAVGDVWPKDKIAKLQITRNKFQTIIFRFNMNLKSVRFLFSEFVLLL